MTTRILSFGAYSFEDGVTQVSDNFGNLAPRTVRLPGLNGGYSEDGIDPSPQAIGTVTLTQMVRADNAYQMRIKLDAIRALSGFGLKRLTILPSSGELPRWCWATVNSIQYSQNVRERPEFHQSVQFTWQVPDPRWYSLGTEGPFWGESTLWGGGVAGGAIWGGPVAPLALTGVQNDFIVTPIGNAPTLAKISVMTSGAQAVTSFKLQRLVAGNIIDQVSYAAALGANATLVIDCRKQSVLLNGLDAYSAGAFAALRSQWMELQPGANTLRVLMGSVGDAASVRVSYFDAYY